MQVLDQLGKKLHTINQVALARMQPGDALQMVHERLLLENWLGAVREQEEMAGDRMAAALEAFYKNQGFKSLRQARLICYGLTQPFGEPSRRLIDEIERLQLLFKYLDRNAGRTRMYRKCYRGLLNCYFAYDPEAPEATVEGRRNWETLRDYLYQRRDKLLLKGFNPEWVAALQEQPSVLTAFPFRRYQFKELQGDWSPLEQIQQRLEVGEDSWFVRRLVLEQIEAVVGFADAEFKEYLDHVLLLLNGHRLYAGIALALLLDRYAQCGETEDSPVLREFSVGLWGNPWLPASAQHWLCGAPAREMVARWLKLHLLRQFFALFADDGQSGSRRRDFWEMYCTDMEGMYFALGRDAFAPGNLDFYQFRNEARGLVVKLSDGARDLHALIMQFDRHHVVEFSRGNNVAYFYDTRHGPPPFYFSEGWIKVGALSVGNALKGSSAKPVSKPLPHKDAKHQFWEGRFAQEMGASENALHDFCGKYRCRYVDFRQREGRQWLHPVSREKCAPEAHAVLQGWGFVWSPEDAGYFRAAA